VRTVPASLQNYRLFTTLIRTENIKQKHTRKNLLISLTQLTTPPRIPHYKLASYKNALYGALLSPCFLLKAKDVYSSSPVTLYRGVTHIRPQKKPIKRNHKLNPIEELYLRNLVENEPQTVNETATTIKKEYTSTFRAFKSLKKRGLIKKTTEPKPYRGRKYPRYMLTPLGIFKARIDGADHKLLEQKAKDNYPEDKGLLCILKTAEVIGTEAYNIAYSALLTKGKLEPSDEALILTAYMQKESNLNDIIRLFNILEEFPEYYRKITENLEQLRMILRQILETIKRTTER